MESFENIKNKIEENRKYSSEYSLKREKYMAQKEILKKELDILKAEINEKMSLLSVKLYENGYVEKGFRLTTKNIEVILEKVTKDMDRQTDEYKRLIKEIDAMTLDWR